MRFLFLGDVVGQSGRVAIAEHLPGLRRKWALDFVVVNGENAAGGFGITESICENFFSVGVDCITLGNHAFDQRPALIFIERHTAVLRPINFPPGTPGRGANIFRTASGSRVLVINVMGRLFMDCLDDPFRSVEAELKNCSLRENCDAILVDIHAEATSEKQALATFLDGQVSLVVGTHTHVPTADYRILPHGTAYLTDAGMTGVYDSVAGMDKEESLRRFMRKVPGPRPDPPRGEATLCGVAVETNASGLATYIAPVRLGGELAQAQPHQWETGD